MTRVFRGGKKIALSALASFKKNSTREFFALSIKKLRGILEDTFDNYEEKKSNQVNSKRGTFFGKYKRMLSKALGKKK